MSRSTALASSSYEPSEKAAAESGGAPPAEQSRCSEDQISSGCDGPHACHAPIAAAALDHGRVTYAVTQPGAGWVRKRSSVTTPKLPHPAPRSAQNSSGLLRASAVTVRP